MNAQDLVDVAAQSDTDNVAVFQNNTQSRLQANAGLKSRMATVRTPIDLGQKTGYQHEDLQNGADSKKLLGLPAELRCIIDEVLLDDLVSTPKHAWEVQPSNARFMHYINLSLTSRRIYGEIEPWFKQDFSHRIVLFFTRASELIKFKGRSERVLMSPLTQTSVCAGIKLPTTANVDLVLHLPKFFERGSQARSLPQAGK